MGIASSQNQRLDGGLPLKDFLGLILPILLVWEIESNRGLERSSHRHHRKRTLTQGSQDAEPSQVMLGRKSMHKKYKKESATNSVSETAPGTPWALRVTTMTQCWISGSRKAVDDTTSHGMYGSTWVAIVWKCWRSSGTQMNRRFAHGPSASLSLIVSLWRGSAPKPAQDRVPGFVL